MADKQYYVKFNYDFEYGVDNEDGTFDVKNSDSGKADWVSMSRDDAIGLQNYAIIPAMTLMKTKAGELGMLVTDLDFPGKDEIINAKGKPVK